MEAIINMLHYCILGLFMCLNLYFSLYQYTISYYISCITVILASISPFRALLASILGLFIAYYFNLNKYCGSI